MGDDAVTLQYLAIKEKVAARLGVLCENVRLSSDVSEESIIAAINTASKKGCDGIVVQLPLPKGIDTDKVLQAIDTSLDIDFLTQQTASEFLSKDTLRMPPVARAVLECITSVRSDLSKEKIVVIGRGRLVGNPVSKLFSKMSLPFTVIDITTEESHKNALLKEATIIVTGAGSSHFITQEMISPGAILIDAGTSEMSGKIVGDVSPSCIDVAAYITPVPGGVGPLAVVSLFENLVNL